MSCGIYKITNTINNKIYIGCSKHIELRWQQHIYETNNEKQYQYNYTIHRAMRKYGIENFTFECIEEVEENQMMEREKYWIDYYDSYNNGYNETNGGDCGPTMFGESNPKAKLTEADVIAIRTMLLDGKMLSEVYPIYADRISYRGFSHIWQGNSWSHILPEAIQYVKSNEYISKARSYAGKSGVSEEKQKIYEDIKKKKENGFSRLEVYEEYKHLYSISGFNKIWYKK